MRPDWGVSSIENEDPVNSRANIQVRFRWSKLVWPETALLHELVRHLYLPNASTASPCNQDQLVPESNDTEFQQAGSLLRYRAPSKHLSFT
jgi:hypothetical protein